MTRVGSIPVLGFCFFAVPCRAKRRNLSHRPQLFPHETSPYREIDHPSETLNSWEYPGYKDHKGTPADTVNYSLFLAEIRKALDALGAKNGRKYGLTAALPCGPDLIDNIQIDVVKDYLDELNLMTYDFHG
jgi:hypothetical protein